MSTQTEPRGGAARGDKRPYEAPEVARVDLKADEVLAIGCKTLRAGIVSGSKCVISACNVRDKS